MVVARETTQTLIGLHNGAGWLVRCMQPKGREWQKKGVAFIFDRPPAPNKERMYGRAALGSFVRLTRKDVNQGEFRPAARCVWIVPSGLIKLVRALRLDFFSSLFIIYFLTDLTPAGLCVRDARRDEPNVYGTHACTPSFLWNYINSYFGFSKKKT
jgi:hypothetical protein